VAQSIAHFSLRFFSQRPKKEEETQKAARHQPKGMVGSEQQM
jgi:hypothetical protein